MNNFKKYILIFLFFAPFTSMAWGVLGHRIVGEVAESHLSSKARKAVKKILGNESMAMASNWPDFIKSNPNYKYLSTWHYVNFKAGLTKTEFDEFLATDIDKDAYNGIIFLTAELKKHDLPDSLKKQYLKILIHLVGDIHQPMHTGRYEDLGGNKIKVQWFNDDVNLHQVWDEKLVDFQQLSYTEYSNAINFSSKSMRKKLQSSPLSQWLYESYGIAENIYANTKPDDKLRFNYNYDYIEIVNNQLLKGGIRLAGLLNEIFD